jgi:hypothetical protein
MEKHTLSISEEVRRVVLNIRRMLVIIFGCDRIVYQEFVPPGQTVHQQGNKSTKNVWNDGGNKTCQFRLTMQECTVFVTTQDSVIQNMDVAICPPY